MRKGCERLAGNVFSLHLAIELAIFRHRPFAALGFEAEMCNSDDLLTEQNKRDDLLTEQNKRDDLLTEQTKALGLLREQS